MGKQNLIILEENCASDSFQALYGLLRLRSMLRTRFVMLPLSKTSERLNKTENSKLTELGGTVCD